MNELMHLQIPMWGVWLALLASCVTPWGRRLMGLIWTLAWAITLLLRGEAGRY